MISRRNLGVTVARTGSRPRASRPPGSSGSRRQAAAGEANTGDKFGVLRRGRRHHRRRQGRPRGLRPVSTACWCCARSRETTVQLTARRPTRASTTSPPSGSRSATSTATATTTWPATPASRSRRWPWCRGTAQGLDAQPAHGAGLDPARGAVQRLSAGRWWPATSTVTATTSWRSGVAAPRSAERTRRAPSLVYAAVPTGWPRTAWRGGPRTRRESRGPAERLRPLRLAGCGSSTRAARGCADLVVSGSRARAVGARASARARSRVLYGRLRRRACHGTGAQMLYHADTRGRARHRHGGQRFGTLDQ